MTCFCLLSTIIYFLDIYLLEDISHDIYVVKYFLNTTLGEYFWVRFFILENN